MPTYLTTDADLTFPVPDAARLVDRFLGATSLKFTSSGGKGLHCYYALAEPVPVAAQAKSLRRQIKANEKAQTEASHKLCAANVQARFPQLS